MNDPIKPVTRSAPPSLDVDAEVQRVERDPSGSERVAAEVDAALADGRVTCAELDRVETAARADSKAFGVPVWSGEIDAHDVAQMRAMLAAPKLDPGVRERIERHIADHEAAVAAGKVVGKANVVVRDGQTVVREHFFVEVGVPLVEVLSRYDPEVWSLNLPYWRAGQVLETGRHVDERGRTIVEHTERMSLDGGDGLADMLRLTNLDMTKKLRVVDDRARGRVRIEWSVYHSDTGSVQKDEGFIELQRVGHGRTRITCKSDHVVNPLGAALIRWLLPEGRDAWLPNQMAESLDSYFTETLRRVRDIATGERDAVTRAEALERGWLIVL